MSAKHYIALADIFAGDLATCSTQGERNKVRGIILSVADLCAKDNSNFNRAMFYSASGLTGAGNLA